MGIKAGDRVRRVTNKYFGGCADMMVVPVGWEGDVYAVRGDMLKLEGVSGTAFKNDFKVVASRTAIPNRPSLDELYTRLLEAEMAAAVAERAHSKAVTAHSKAITIYTEAKKLRRELLNA